MKIKTVLFVFLLICSTLFVIKLSDAAACDPNGMVQNCTVGASITMNFSANSTYFMNGTNDGSSIPVRISANNVVIDCAGVKFVGNYSTGSAETGIRWSRPQGFNNVTYKNCILNNYYNGIGFVNTETSGTISNVTFNSTFQAIDVTTGRNINISQNTFKKADKYGIFLEPNSNLWFNLTIDSNICFSDVVRCINAQGHPVNIAGGLLINNNTVYNGTASAAIYTEYVNNVSFTNNVISSNISTSGAGGPVLSSSGIRFMSLSNVTILSNNVSGYDSGINSITEQRFLNATTNSWFCGNLTTAIVVANNLVFNNDRGIRLRGVFNANVSSNTFLNNTNGVDAYDVGLYFEECSSNVLVNANNFSKTGSTAIFAEAMNGMVISNNVIDMLNNSEKTARLVNDVFQYPSAIVVGEMYKNFVQGNRTGQAENITFVQSMRSSNVSLSGNSYDSDTQLFGTFQGVTNYSTDFSNFWYRSWSPYIDLSDTIEYYSSSSYSFLTWTNSLGSIKDASFYGYGNTTGVPTYMAINFTMQFEKWANINQTGPRTFSRSNSTNALFFNQTNNLCSGSSSDISTNDGTLNIVLQHIENCTVLDNFNLTEGVSRLNSPLNLTGSSSTSKVKTYSITNSLSSNLTNVIMILNPSPFQCSKINSVVLDTNTGSNYGGTYSCDSSGNLVVTNVNLDTGATITLSGFGDFNSFCSSVTSGYSNFFVAIVTIMGILAIAIIVVFLVFLARTVQGEGQVANTNFLDQMLETLDPRAVMAGILLIALIAFLAIVTFGALCA